jgi:predicted MPP superfamily phosphohydrolase
MALTGDYVSDDPAAQGEVVQALAGLCAPCGVFGCLGNMSSIYAARMSQVSIGG